MVFLLLACVAAPEPTGRPADSSPGPDSTPSGESTPDDSSADSHSTGETGETGGTTPPVPPLQFVGPPPRNVLLITVDTTRRDQIGAWSGLDTTPNLDRILAEGVRLADHRTCSNWTEPSMLCIITGRFPIEDGYWPTGVYDSGGDPRVPDPPLGLPTLATLLSDRGFVTGLVTSNGVFSGNNSQALVEGYGTVVEALWQPAPRVAVRGRGMLQNLAADGAPWFGHVHFIDPHGPYVAPESYSYELAALDPKYDFPYDVTDSSQVYNLFAEWSTLSEKEQEIARQYLFAVYHGELRYWDETFGTFWSDLDAAGLLDDTLVVFAADHGEQLGEHDSFQHGQALFNEENRVPAGFWARNLVPGVWEGPTIHQDLSPTVLSALGLEASTEHTGVVLGEAPDQRSRFTFSYLQGYCDPVMAIVKEDLHLIYQWDGKRYLFDVDTDPDEANDRYSATDPDAVALWTELEPQVQVVAKLWPFLVPRGTAVGAGSEVPAR